MEPSIPTSAPTERERALQAVILGAVLGFVMALLARSPRRKAL